MGKSRPKDEVHFAAFYDEHLQHLCFISSTDSWFDPSTDRFDNTRYMSFGQEQVFFQVTSCAYIVLHVYLYNTLHRAKLNIFPLADVECH